MKEKERYYSLIDHNGNFELRDYECGKDIHSLYELDDLLNQQDKRIKELETLLKTVREFETPRIERYAVVQYSHWENKPYKIVRCFDCYKDKDMKIVHCYYGVKSTNFKVIKVCDTREDAENLIRELKK